MLWIRLIDSVRRFNLIRMWIFKSRADRMFGSFYRFQGQLTRMLIVAILTFSQH